MLKGKYVRRVAQDYIGRTLQDSTAGLLEQVARTALLDGRLIEGLATQANQPFVVDHGLGRAYKGYLVMRSQGAHVSVYDELSPGLSSKLSIRLVPSATATIALWVF